MAAKRDAEYFRQYRATVKPINERNARADGIQDGLSRCIRYLREKVADRALTGYQAALMIERAMLNGENFSVTARQKFIDALREGEQK